ncbi:hypothetical protein FRC11_005661 [Ceratobasidium sp. 423]|nr:hypothetical protein FRC11_005661 [Ceratobasidium sp. 423]
MVLLAFNIASTETLGLRFVATSEKALRDVAAHGHSKGKEFNDAHLQAQLDKAIETLWEYWDQLASAVDESDNYDPINLMYEARKKDEVRQRTIMTKENLQKITIPKETISFYIHDGTATPTLTPHRICKESTAEEVLFKLGRDPAVNVKLHENASFYTHLSWKGEETMAVNLGLTSSRTSEMCPKKGFSDFKKYFDIKGTPGPVHVFVDRNPCIHVLLTTTKWSRLFSLVKIIEKNKTIVLKGVDGTLYHAQQVVNELITPNAKVDQYWVSRREQQGTRRTRQSAGLKAPASDCITNLLQAREYISKEDARHQWPDPSWLIEIPSQALKDNPTFDKWGSNPKFASASGSRPTMLKWNPAPSTGHAASSSTSLTTQGSGTVGGADQAHSVVKRMAMKYEEDRKKNEKKEKSFLGRFFGKKP